MNSFLTLVFYSYLAYTLQGSAIQKVKVHDRISHKKAHHIHRVSVGIIGIRFDARGHIVLVRPNTPAEQAGILKGDRLVSADGGEDFDLIDGEPGSTLDLVIQRKDEIMGFKIIRRSVDEMPWLPPLLVSHAFTPNRYRPGPKSSPSWSLGLPLSTLTVLFVICFNTPMSEIRDWKGRD